MTNVSEMEQVSRDVQFDAWVKDYGSMEDALRAVLIKYGETATRFADEIFHSQELCDVLDSIASQFPDAAEAVDGHNARLLALFEGKEPT